MNTGKLTEEGLQEVIKLYEAKEEELNKREKLFEQRVKEMNEKFDMQKTKNEIEMYSNELDFQSQQNRDKDGANKDGEGYLKEQFEQLKQEHTLQIKDMQDKFNYQIREKEDTINKIKLIKQTLEQEQTQLSQQLKEENELLNSELAALKLKEKDHLLLISQLQAEALKVALKTSPQVIQMSLTSQRESQLNVQTQTEDQLDEQKDEVFVTASKSTASLVTLEQKYHLLKKKLKKQKELTDIFSKDNQDLKALMSISANKNQDKLQLEHKNESRMRELEVALSKSKDNVKMMNTLGEQLRNAMEQLEVVVKEKEEVEEDMRKLFQYKQELEHICEQLKGKIDRKRAKEVYLKETLEFKEQELEKKEIILRKMTQSAEDANRQLKVISLKLRQVEQTKVKDLKKKVQLQDSIITDLQLKIKTYHDSSKSPSSRKPNHMQRSQSKNNISKSRIEEAEEVFEATDQNFNFQQQDNASRENIFAMNNRSIDQKNSILPEIPNNTINKKYTSIKNSMERIPRGQQLPSAQDKYDKHYDEFVTKIRDPVHRHNNSHAVKGIFGGSNKMLDQLSNNDEVNYELRTQADQESNRESKIKKILEGTEQYEKLLFYTPEKNAITSKINANRRGGKSMKTQKEEYIYKQKNLLK